MPPPPAGNILASLVERASHSNNSDALVNWRIFPPPNSAWDQIAAFALTYDGYNGGARSIDECVRVHDKVIRQGFQGSTIEDLLVFLFVMQRRVKWNSQMDVSEIIEIRNAQHAVEAIRTLISARK